MKRILMIAIAAAGIAGAMNAETIRGRQAHQQARIAKGVRSGSLTPHETAHIERQEAHLNRTIRRDRRDGGGLSAAERAKIDNRQDHLSNEIYRKKHNGRTQ
jgi:hypothetical protein